MAWCMVNNTIAHSLDLGGDTVAVIREQIVDSLGAANSRHTIVLSLINQTSTKPTSSYQLSRLLYRRTDLR